MTNSLSSGLRLEPLAETHIEGLRSLRNSPEIRRWFFDSAEVSAAAQQRWFQDFEQDPDNLLWVGLDAQGRVRAAAGIRVSGTSAEFGRLMVDRSSPQARGLGRELVRWVLAWAADHGVSDAWLAVVPDNVHALAVYRSCGFVDTGEQHGGGLVLRKSLDPPISLFVPQFRVDECLSEIRECLERGWTGMGYKTCEIEQRWQEYTGLPNAHFVNSGTAALHVAVAMLKQEHGWADGDEIISTPLTFVSTNHAIIHAGMRPVFADVDEYCCLDPDSLAARVGPRTRAVMFVGLAGSTGGLAAVAARCRELGLPLILDAAHMAGTKLDGAEPGSLADVACYSFQAVKNLPTADSGMVCFADPRLDARARQFSWMGIDKSTYARWNAGTYSWRYDVDVVGYKHHGNSVMAALALVGLRYLDQDNSRRREIAGIYDQQLAGLPLATVPMPDGCLSARHLYQLRTPARDPLVAHLQQRGVFPGVHYRCNTDYAPYRDQGEACPRARAAAAELVSLPLHVGLSDRDAHRVTDAVADFFQVHPPQLPTG